MGVTLYTRTTGEAHFGYSTVREARYDRATTSEIRDAWYGVLTNGNDPMTNERLLDLQDVRDESAHVANFYRGLLVLEVLVGTALAVLIALGFSVTLASVLLALVVTGLVVTIVSAGTNGIFSTERSTQRAYDRASRTLAEQTWTELMKSEGE